MKDYVILETNTPQKDLEQLGIFEKLLWCPQPCKFISLKCLGLSSSRSLGNMPSDTFLMEMDILLHIT